MIRADRIYVDDDEGRFILIIDSDDGILRVDIHADAIEFYKDVRRKIGPYAAEAESARQAVAAGVSLEDYTGATVPEIIRNRPVSVEDAIAAGYALDDPKSPGYHDRVVD